MRAGRWGWFILALIGLWRAVEAWGTLDFLSTRWTELSPGIRGWLTSGALQVVLVVGGVAWVVVAPYLPSRPKRLTREELGRQRDEALLEVQQLRGEVELLRQQVKERALPERVFFHHPPYCWELTRYFFEKYDEIDTPLDLQLDYSVRGPFCPACGRNLRIDEPGSPYTIAAGCLCGFGTDAPGNTAILHRMQREIYKEAQRLTRHGKDLPAGPCAKPPKLN